MRFRAGLAIALLGLGPALAQDIPQDIPAERARLAQARAQALARQAEDEAACQKRFAVTPCLDDTRRRWQGLLADLRRQELALADAERKRRGDEQLRSLEEKTSPKAQEAASERRAQAQAEHQARQARAADKDSRPQGSDRSPSDSRSPAPGNRLTPEEEAANARAHAQRVQKAQERRERAQERAASRAKPPASSLPVPGIIQAP